MSGGGRQTFRRVIQISGAILILVSGIRGLTKGVDFASVVSTPFGCLLLAGIIRYWNLSNARTLQINSRTYLIQRSGLAWCGSCRVGRGAYNSRLCAADGRSGMRPCVLCWPPNAVGVGANLTVQR
jgi:hypothetical protein